MAGTALVKLPSAAEVEHFTKQPDIVIGPTPSMPSFPSGHWMGGLVYMEDAKGRFEPIGYVQEINISCAVDEVLTWDGDVKLIPGLKRGTLKFGGPF